ncbi:MULTISPECIES: DUF4112 domain-containing protein [Caulobacter]|jgi:hypothetical protein|uniref:DUF4112 domain-containing protein n=1 Tax=Caulobacter rhizosphaerae TaxID=2010972 RepID=A0ABU1N5A2_9CAUL|nr:MULTISPECIES: DUF4112 domain-containing protein [Caulobacter]KQZ32312.1 hypothetical protein ASD47_14620 [Caulobacter sp. Root1472]MDR6533628.1 hypothetical protein [Caulobacter rhizosphaerae]GGL40960.1 hypothetical protein GCM10010983_42620 [Caulobacter rhizosphaerae]
MTERSETLEGYVVDEGPASERQKAHQAWRHAETIKRLSDRLIGIGPFGLGLDGVLAWVPWAGLAYGLGAGGLLLFHAVQAKASTPTLARMAAYLAADNLSDTVPVLGWAVDTLFPGHLMAAKALQKDVEARHGLPEEIDPKTRKKRRSKKTRS